MAERLDEATERLETEKVGRLLLDYSIPAVIGMVMMSMYNIVDRIFIGQGVGPLAISGLALTFPLMTLVTAIGTLVGVGASSRISIVLGMKDLRWARNILGNAFVLTFLFSGVLVTLSMLFLDDVLVWFGGSDRTIPYAREYLRIVIPGSILSNLSYSFSGIMRASGYPRKSMYTVLIGVGANVVFDPIFIFGFGMGIRGAAVATVLSMSLSAMFVLGHFFDSRHQVHFRRDSWGLRPRIIRNIVSIGMAPFLMNTAASVVNIIMNNRLVENGGDLAIGAFGIVNSYAILVIMVVMGICQAMQPIVGYNYGARKYKRVKDVLLLTIRVATIAVTVGFVCCETFPGVMVRAFTSDPDLAEMARQGMRLAYMMWPVVGFQIVVSTFFQSIGKAYKAIFMGLSRQVIFLIPALYLFASRFGLEGIWLSMPFSDSLAAIIGLCFLLREKKILYGRTVRKV
ncbi:MATE family efflux transporter [uncultured Alistipes sp.]|uniref:MATE family efflux transporter n=1 Tax=uncultured Alistipes sp. TaxID=538949 RepID=UPI002637C6A7|nr:MATE family efflux transporter [uncultured Alistipes sp.]